MLPISLGSIFVILLVLWFVGVIRAGANERDRRNHKNVPRATLIQSDRVRSNINLTGGNSYQ
jgi:hypothetical protein